MALLDPAQYDQTPVLELLRAAARGTIGVDRLLLTSILNRGDAAAADVLTFSRDDIEQQRIDLAPLVIDLFRHFKTPEALDFYIAAVRHNPEEVGDDLIRAFLPFGARAVEPLLKLYEELGEEQGSDVAFLLAGLRVHDPRVLQLLLDRLEFDAADGAFCLGLYGDPAARPALDMMLAEIPASEVELRREIQYAIEQLGAPAPHYQPEPFDIFAEYPKRDLPAFDILSDPERLELLGSSDPAVRAGAAHSFFNAELSPEVRKTLFDAARNDPDPNVRGRAWESLADATENEEIRSAMIAVLQDTARPIEERGGAAVGLYAVADQDQAHEGIEALYQEGGNARVKALEAMWRSLWKPYSKYFAPHLEADDPKLVREALRGAGYFQLASEIDKIASYFDRDDKFEDLREDALFAYALAMPGETTRGRVKGMLRKIDSIAELDPDEAELVMFALDERLRLKGLDPVFAEEQDHHHDHDHDHSGHDHTHDHSVAEPAQQMPKVGRNDPCPCGSGKKYKKCHGA